MPFLATGLSNTHARTLSSSCAVFEEIRDGGISPAMLDTALNDVKPRASAEKFITEVRYCERLVCCPQDALVSREVLQGYGDG